VNVNEDGWMCGWIEIRFVVVLLGALFLMDFVTNVASSMIWAFCYMMVQPRGNENVICFATCMAYLQEKIRFMPLQLREIGFHVENHATPWHGFQHEIQFQEIVVAWIQLTLKNLQ